MLHDLLDPTKSALSLTLHEEDAMQPSTRSEVRHRDLEAWTRADADAWREAECHPVCAEAWTNDDVLLESDLWTDDNLVCDLSPLSLRRLGVGTI